MNRVRKLMRKLDNGERAQSPKLRPLREVVYDIYANGRSPLEWWPIHAITQPTAGNVM